MASLSIEKNGCRRIQFMASNGKRLSIRIGIVPLKVATPILNHVETIIEARRTNTPLAASTVEWLNTLSDSMKEKLTIVGLIDRQDSLKLGEFLEAYIKSRTDVKQSTREHLQRAANDLIDFFDENREIQAVTEADAEEFKRWLSQTRNLNENTVNRRTGRARQFFNHAKKREIVKSNPFDGLKVTVYANEDRFYFVSAEDVRKIIDKAPSAEWRLLIALSRWGGLRTPSEHLRLTWGDILWDENKMVVTSPKLEHHHDKGKRLIPIFPEVRPYLDEVWENAKEKQKFVFTQFKRDKRETNLRTQFARIAQRAGVVLWEKPFQNMRSTRQIELAETFPQHVVCKWIGNSQVVARKHYLRPTEEHFRKASGLQQVELSKAVQNSVHTTPEQGGNGPQLENDQEKKSPQVPILQALAAICVCVLKRQKTPNSPTRGRSDFCNSLYRNGLRQFQKEGGAKSNALGDLPMELQILIKAWPNLPDAGKVRVMAILLEESNSNMGQVDT